MRAARRYPYMVLILVAASAMVTPSWADPAVNPFETLTPPYPTEFRDYPQLFARILADRGLDRGFDQSLLPRIQADSRIDRVHDRSPEPIDVVRVDLRNPDGSSRVRTKTGDFPFYVLRETPNGLVLIGQMFGSTYSSYIRRQRLEFRVEQHLSSNTSTTMRFRVEGGVLVDLSAPDLKWRPSVVTGIARCD